MEYTIEQAKNGQKTLLLNGKYIYSKYNPIEDANKFIIKEFDNSSESYLLIGLGLGYHLQALLNLSKGKKVDVLYFDKIELNIIKNNLDLAEVLQTREVQLLHVTEITDIMRSQLIIPNVWLNAIGDGHPLYSLLSEIKLRKTSFEQQQQLLEENFSKNILLNDLSIMSYEYKRPSSVACLVSSGPSLDTKISLLKQVRERVYIICAGSALKALISKGIIPDSIVITDARDFTLKQITENDFNGPLFYLPTAYYKAIESHKGDRYIVYQAGYILSEKKAKSENIPLLETGGSVATLSLSILEYLGFENIILFGQDLGFKGNYTHSQQSSSNEEILYSNYSRSIKANNGEIIYTRSQYLIYKNWFERKIKKSRLKVFNTSEKGAVIEGAIMISDSLLEELIVDGMNVVPNLI